MFSNSTRGSKSISFNFSSNGENIKVISGYGYFNFSYFYDFIDDLDEIPLYDYGMLDLSDYRLNPTISAYPGMDSSKPHVTFMSSRGCPFLCTFCSAHSVHGRKMRYYSLDRVKEDIRILQEEFGTETIIFQDDLCSQFIYLFTLSTAEKCIEISPMYSIVLNFI